MTRPRAMSFFARLLDTLGVLFSSSSQSTSSGSSSGGLKDAKRPSFLEKSRRLSRIREIKERREITGLDALIEALSIPDTDVRTEAMIAMYSLGGDTRSALPVVLRCLQDPHDSVRQWAVSVLAPGSMNPPAEEIFPALIARFLEDPSASVRREVISILTAHLSERTEALLPTVLPVFVGGMRDPVPEVRRQTVYSVGSYHRYLSSDPRARKLLADGLLRGLQDPDDTVRRRSAVALSYIDPSSIAGLPTLREMLLRPERPHVVSDAADALQRLQGDEPRALLFDLLKSPDLALRARAAFALLPGHLPREAFQEIVSVFHTNQGKLLEEFLVLLHLRPLEPWQKEALIPPLLSLLGTSSETARSAVRLLAQIGENHPGVIRAVIQQIRQGDEEMRQEAAEALGRVCKDASVAVPVLRGLLRDPDEGVRRDATRALGWLGEPAVAAVPEMLAVLSSDSSSYTRTTAIYALGSIGPAASAAIPAMIALLGSPEASVREGAAEALARVNASSALLQGNLPGWILNALQTERGSMKGYLLRAVATCGEAGAPFAETVATFLTSEDTSHAEYAIQALDAFGAGAAAAVPAMLAALPITKDYQQQRLLRALCKAKDGLRDGDELAFIPLVRGATAQRVRNLMPDLVALGPRGSVALLEATQHQDEALCKAATDALQRLGNEAIPGLALVLHGEDASLRLRAVGALSDLGEAAHPVLRKALPHADEMIQMQIEIALG